MFSHSPENRFWTFETTGQRTGTFGTRGNCIIIGPYYWITVSLDIVLQAEFVIDDGADDDEAGQLLEDALNGSENVDYFAGDDDLVLEDDEDEDEF